MRKVDAYGELRAIGQPMIEQIPARIEIASLARSQEIVTPLGRFATHRLAPEVFTGFEGQPARGGVNYPGAGPTRRLQLT